MGRPGTGKQAPKPLPRKKIVAAKSARKHPPAAAAPPASSGTCSQHRRHPTSDAGDTAPPSSPPALLSAPAMPPSSPGIALPDAGPSRRPGETPRTYRVAKPAVRHCPLPATAGLATAAVGFYRRTRAGLAALGRRIDGDVGRALDRHLAGTILARAPAGAASPPPLRIAFEGMRTAAAAAEAAAERSRSPSPAPPSPPRAPAPTPSPPTRHASTPETPPWPSSPASSPARARASSSSSPASPSPSPSPSTRRGRLTRAEEASRTIRARMADIAEMMAVERGARTGIVEA
ncbi:hypothetical protein B0A55_09330, partial [Friedmanniomyces simplex]